MRYDDLFIAGYGNALPAPMPAAEAVLRGLCEERIVKDTDMASVTVADDDWGGPEMAAAAGRLALSHSGLAPGDIDLVTYSGLYYCGHDMWAPASYVHRHTVGGSGPAVEIRQTSNGGMAAMDLAAGYLTTGPRRAALLTCGDHFCLPGIDRWRSDPGTVFADGGSAVVLSRLGGFARLRSLVVGGDSELELMHRGDDPFSPAPLTLRAPLDVQHTTRTYLRAAGTSYAISRMAAGQQQVVKTALAEADVDVPGVDLFVLPHFGRKRMVAQFFRWLEIEPDRTTWPWGRTIGHLGAGDQFAGLAFLGGRGVLRRGMRVALIGVGGGFSWSCAVLEIM